MGDDSLLHTHPLAHPLQPAQRRNDTPIADTALPMPRRNRAAATPPAPGPIRLIHWRVESGVVMSTACGWAPMPAPGSHGRQELFLATHSFYDAITCPSYLRARREGMT